MAKWGRLIFYHFFISSQLISPNQMITNVEMLISRLRNRLKQLAEILSLSNLHQLVKSNASNTHINLP